MKNTNLVNKINEMNVQELSIEGLKATRKRVDDLLTMFTVGCVEDAKEAAQNKINEIDARIEELEAPVVEEVEVEEVTEATQYNLFDIIDKNLQEKEQTMGRFEGKLRVFEAFAGVGSQRMALRNLGIDHEVVGIAEIDKFALAAYEAIHGDCPNYGDISKIDPHELPDMDLFTYSFPCQDLSQIGKKAGLGKGTRSGLLYECEKIIEVKRPKFLLLENVKNLVGKKFKPEFDKWLEYLEGLGYSNYWQVLDASKYGVPQTRNRVFAVSILNGEGYKFPTPKNHNKKIKDILEPITNDKFFVSEMVQARLKIKRPDTGEFNIIGSTSPDFRTIGQRDDVYGMNSLMGALVATDYKQPKQILCNGRVKRLTPLECWRLMGFTDQDFYKAQAVCSNSQLYKQAGNSIVVNVLEGIFKNLFL